MAVKELNPKPDLIIVDALSKIDTEGIPYKSIIKGDAKCYSIACASIIAKVTRDRIMRQWDEVYPQYGFIKHKGYGTAAHISAIKEYGLCPLHRLSRLKNNCVLALLNCATKILWRCKKHASGFLACLPATAY